MDEQISSGYQMVPLPILQIRKKPLSRVSNCEPFYTPYDYTIDMNIELSRGKPQISLDFEIFELPHLLSQPGIAVKKKKRSTTSNISYFTVHF